MDKESIKSCIPVSNSPLYDRNFVEKVRGLPKLKRKKTKSFFKWSVFFF